jgi:hypothetical protein
MSLRGFVKIDVLEDRIALIFRAENSASGKKTALGAGGFSTLKNEQIHSSESRFL